MKMPMTTDAATFRALAQRARHASGPDRALDADVWFAVLPDEEKCVLGGERHVAFGYGSKGRTFQPLVVGAANVPLLSSSLNEIQREAVPKGWVLDWPPFNPQPPFHCYLYPPTGAGGLQGVRGNGQSQALAALAAALEAQAILAEPTP